MKHEGLAWSTDGHVEKRVWCKTSVRVTAPSSMSRSTYGAELPLSPTAQHEDPPSIPLVSLNPSSHIVVTMFQSQNECRKLSQCCDFILYCHTD